MLPGRRREGPGRVGDVLRHELAFTTAPLTRKGREELHSMLRAQDKLVSTQEKNHPDQFPQKLRYDY